MNIGILLIFKFLGIFHKNQYKILTFNLVFLLLILSNLSFYSIIHQQFYYRHKTVWYKWYVTQITN